MATPSVALAPYVHGPLDAVIAHIAAAGCADLEISGHIINHQVAGADGVNLNIAADALES